MCFIFIVYANQINFIRIFFTIIDDSNFKNIYFTNLKDFIGTPYIYVLNNSFCNVIEIYQSNIKIPINI